MAKKNKNLGGKKMILQGAHTPERKHHCRAHDITMTPIKVFGKKRVQFECKEGCRLLKRQTVLK